MNLTNPCLIFSCYYSCLTTQMRGFSTNLFRVSFHITNINSASPRQWEVHPTTSLPIDCNVIFVPVTCLKPSTSATGAPVRPVAVSNANKYLQWWCCWYSRAIFFLGVLLTAIASLAVCAVFIFCKRRSSQGSFDINKNAAVDYERHSDNVALSSPTDDKIQ